jgi:hypothetical protein
MKKSELVALLRRVERAMSDNPKFNAWDLGPCDLLKDVRTAIGDSVHTSPPSGAQEGPHGRYQP